MAGDSITAWQFVGYVIAATGWLIGLGVLALMITGNLLDRRRRNAAVRKRLDEIAAYDAARAGDVYQAAPFHIGGK